MKALFHVVLEKRLPLQEFFSKCHFLAFFLTASQVIFPFKRETCLKTENKWKGEIR